MLGGAGFLPSTVVQKTLKKWLTPTMNSIVITTQKAPIIPVGTLHQKQCELVIIGCTCLDNGNKPSFLPGVSCKNSIKFTIHTRDLANQWAK